MRRQTILPLDFVYTTLINLIGVGNILIFLFSLITQSFTFILRSLRILFFKWYTRLFKQSLGKFSCNFLLVTPSLNGCSLVIFLRGLKNSKTNIKHGLQILCCYHGSVTSRSFVFSSLISWIILLGRGNNAITFPPAVHHLLTRF